MSATRYVIAVTLSAFCSLAICDDPPVKIPAPEIVLLEPPQTIEEAIKRRAARESEAAKQLAAAQKLFDEQMADVDKEAVQHLDTIARRAVADGDIADASAAWEAILRLDGTNAAALTFFRTIKRLDIIKKYSDRQPNRPLSISALAGRWTGRWGTTGKEIRFKFGDDGSPLKLINGRILYLNPDEPQKIELIPIGDALLVLGWTTRLGRDPQATLPSLRAIPDHVGFVQR
ncbi:hypothetical protein [Roseimaritima ulvae]|uniref:Uncharacterized protein n=1 Tax=Roseimaritima ulvae TaxID=980254 RepID=A0A5B9QWL6_9BACT|nr:hypothetical protein [Roseimaritima ulvae]QEG43438.1 hypothetical protein UC8_54870 [Roseimaritima ulvae]